MTDQPPDEATAPPADLLEQPFFRLSLDLLCVANLQGRFVLLNPSWERLLGWSLDELYATPFLDFVHPEDVDATVAEMGHLADGVETLEFSNRYRCKDGSWKRLSWRTHPSPDGLLYASAHDITVQEERAEELRQVSAELEAHAAELSRKNAELRHANRLKSEFLANMSHELRTPLNAIIGFSEILKDGVVGPMDPDQVEYATEIFGAGHHLLSLINDILDLSKIEAGHMTLDLVSLDPATLLQSSLTIVQERASARQLAITLNVVGDLGRIEGDERKLKQVVFNLLSNAVKFTEVGGAVAVEAARAEHDDVECLVVTVEDTGIGIAAADLDRIFRPFEQLDGSVARRFDGTGLGLALVKRLLTLHGGGIEVESEPGVGSTFRFWVPVAPRIEPPPQPERRRVLLATRDGAQPVWLRRAGVDVDLGRGDEALSDQTARLKPDAVLLEVDDGPDGSWDPVLELRADPRTAAVPVVLLSSADPDGEPSPLGVADLLLKPIDGPSLLERLDALGLGPRSRLATRVLVVDDDPVVHRVLQAILGEAGYEVLSCLHGAEALDAIVTERPHLLLLDLMMPTVDGFAVLRQLRDRRDTRELPVVVLTAKELTPAERRFLVQGTSRLLRGKPDSQTMRSLLALVTHGLSEQPREHRTEVLVVEDDPAQAELLCRALRQAGYAAVCTRDGVDALRQIAHRPPALIVLDLIMPALDGFGVLDVLDASGHAPGLPRVVWTAHELSTEERGALESRVQGVFLKGQTPLAEVVERVGDLIGRRVDEG